MKHLKTMALGTAMLGAVLLFVQTNAQVKKGKERPLTTKHMMAGLILPHYSDVGKTLKSEEPIDEKGWDKLATQTELLNEAAYLMMEDGRCPDEKWAAACKMMRESTVALLKAVNEKKIEDAKTALGEVSKACKGCHTAHKK